ncbi:hypothetical protein EVA_03098 [gut metagenome]|uniref:Uncharacterized protein n=1 Tax=gut metagenome TaxID=749906 RepID=J9GLL4_9ZZZZ
MIEYVTFRFCVLNNLSRCNARFYLRISTMRRAMGITQEKRNRFHTTEGTTQHQAARLLK